MFPTNITTSFSKYLHFARKYELKELMNDIKEHNLTKGVVIESGWHSKMEVGHENLENLNASIAYSKVNDNLVQDETNFVLGVAAFTNLTLGREKVTEAVEEHIKANPNVRSFRHQLAWHESKKIMPSSDASKEMSKQPDFRGY